MKTRGSIDDSGLKNLLIALLFFC